MGNELLKDNQIIQTIILNARPGAGKSELIKYLNQLDPIVRAREYHIGKIHVIDDFPILWRWFEEDDLLEKMGKDRLFSDHEGYFKHTYLWDLLIYLVNLEYDKFIRDRDSDTAYTTVIEFSRGLQHGGYARAYPLLSDAILQNACLLYVNVSWAESLRKNRQRFNPDRPDSILEHGIPDEKLEFMYAQSDFEAVTENDPAHIQIKGYQVPYCLFENEDDVTTDAKPELGSRLKLCLDMLWEQVN